MSIIEVPIGQLVIDPLNVRTNEEDQHATEALEASILAKGLIFPLVVRPLSEGPHAGKLGVLAGGRRMRAIDALVARGALPVDWPVRVDRREDLADKDVIELSTAENLLRRPLRAYEIYAAYAAAAAAGATVDEIAREYGQTTRFVEKQLRLGNLAGPIFAAFATGAIDEKQASAFAATADPVAQLAAWHAILARGAYDRGVDRIHAALKVGDAEQLRRLAYVGEEAYQAVGGRFELDLFDDSDQRGIISDEAILERLWSEKIEGERAAIRAACDREITFAPKPPEATWGGRAWDLQITPVISAGRYQLPPGDIVCVLEVDAAGRLDRSFWWRDEDAKRRRGKPARAAAAEPTPAPAPTRASNVPPGPIREGGAFDDQWRNGDRLKADTVLKTAFGLSQDGVEIARTLRRAILRAALVEDAQAGGTAGHDYLIWSLVRQEAREGFGTQSAVGAVSLTGLDAPPMSAADAIPRTPAHETFDLAIAELRRHTFMTEADEAAAFVHFRRARPEIRNLAAAVVAGLALRRSLNAQGYRIPVHDALAAETGRASSAAMRHHWRPDTRFLDLLSKAERLAAAEPFLDPKAAAAWAKLKAGETSRRVADLFRTGADAKARMGQLAREWVHPLLRFDPPDPPQVALSSLDQDADQHDLERYLEASDAR